ncbi:MAG: OmpA family protein [Xanthomonadales bacterium]|nr:OmpA family protein [Xanthomonadales bacterium]
MNTKQKPNTPLRALAVGVSVCLMAACASTPQKSPELVRLENELSRLRADPVVAGNAGAELSEAQRAIDLIASDGKRMRADLYDHNVYLAGRLLDIAESEGRATHARDASERLVAERDRLVADARAMEAERARREANAARAAADQARMQASDASRAADMARAQAEAERLQAMQARDAAEAERQRAMQAREEAEAARAELQAMRQLLADLEAKQTERGLVVTLGDVLFEVDRAELKPGAQRNLDKLVAALSEHEDTVIAIEGHTDSTGSSAYNESLSQRRAEAVQQYLTSHGIDRKRLTARGLGEDFPVASNDSASGRQQNRRVEIIIQNESLAAR